MTGSGRPRRVSKKSVAWLRYERAIFEELSTKFPEASVTHDVTLAGSRSGAGRQIDVLVEERLGDGLVRTAVDAKLRRRRIDVKEVEAYLGCLRDIGVERGIMVAASGYTRAATERARRDEVDYLVPHRAVDSLPVRKPS